MPPRRAVAPSPARSTRSSRSRQNDDDWESERPKKEALVGLSDTSVNVAAAFHAAQNGNLPTPTSLPARSSKSPITERQKSPAQVLAASARALTPVRYFLRPADEEEDYPSFSSLGSGNQSKSAETSYDYRQEEEYVKKAQKGKSKRNEDLPYRPAEDDWEPGSDESGGEGDGVVRGGGLEGRANTRGTRNGSGKGYLGMGLGLRSRSTRHGTIDEVEEEPYREVTPARSRRSPTPVQVITRALSPLIERRRQKRRQPSTARTVVTNLLHGLVMALKFVCEIGVGVFYALVVSPLGKIFDSSRQALASFRRNWWMWLLGVVGLSLFFRILDALWQARAPALGSVNELAARLSDLERMVMSLSNREMLDVPGAVENSVVRRLAAVESAVRDQADSLRKQVDGLRSRADSTDKRYQTNSDRLDGLGVDVDGLRKRVGVVEDRIDMMLSDGRLEQALERMLPRMIPVRIKSGGAVDIDPSFWTAMQKVFARKGEAEKGDTLSRELDAWGERFVERKTADGSLVNRSDFIKLLQSEVVNLKDMINSLSRPKSVKAGKDDVTSVLQDLIDAALLKYSKDTIARPDYALFTAGARVIPSITSDTLVMSSPGFIGRVVLGRKPVEGRSPATALHPDISVGSCWPFAGGQGQLGVLLNRRVRITDVTIEHAAGDVALDTSTAPKEVEVWAIVEGNENKAKVAAVQESTDRIKLGTFQYDPHAPSHIQTFPVDPSAVELGVDVGVVIFKIVSNWGGDFTCLYRVRVHGET